MRYLILILLVASCVACERQPDPAATGAPDEPTCEQVVERADELAIDWAARESDEKGEAMREVIEKEKAKSGRDPAVALCEQKLTAEQKRCVMNAKDLVEKNDCLKGHAAR